MTFHRIEIINESEDPVGYQTRVLLDGKPLICKEIHLSVVANELTTCTVVLDAVVNADVPADITAVQEVLVSEVRHD